MSPRELPFVLPYPKTKAASMLFVCLGFVALGAQSLLRNPTWIDYAIGYPSEAIFGLGALVFVMALLPGAPHLRVTSDGIEIVNYVRITRYRWSDIERISWHANYTHLCFRAEFIATLPPASRPTLIDDQGTQYDDILSIYSRDYGMRAEDLATMLEAIRKEQIAESAPTSDARS
jgi:hypothetical protein